MPSRIGIIVKYILFEIFLSFCKKCADMQKKNCDLILALDLPDKESALEMLGTLKGSLRWVKIGLQMYVRYGADFVREVSDMDFKIFLDLKLHDIPNTVASAIKSLRSLPVDMLTIHTSGGREMMKYALDAARETNPDLLLLGVTVLTSFNAEGLRETGVGLPPEKQVELLARLAVDSSLKGLVCSPLEVEPLRRALPGDVKLVTPGIRPAGASSDEQKRVMTPAMAAAAGSDVMLYGTRLGYLERYDISVRKTCTFIDSRRTLELDTLAVPDNILVALGRIGHFAYRCRLACCSQSLGHIRSKACDDVGSRLYRIRIRRDAAGRSRSPLERHEVDAAAA